MQNEVNLIIISSDQLKTIIKISGSLNSDSKEKFLEKLGEIKNKSKNYIFDISELEYISSSGVGFFMELYEIVNDKNGKICFVSMNNVVRRVFDYMGFLAFFGDAENISKAEEYIG